jgi:hypothetical protein
MLARLFSSRAPANRAAFKKRKHRVAVCYPMFSGGEKKPYYSINAVIDIAAGAL